MKTTRVSCQGCGASLEVHDLARYATCAYCATKLEVVHETSAMQAQALDVLERHNRRLSAEVTEYRLRDELSLLDSAWERLRKSWLEPDGKGAFYDPSGGYAAFSALISLIGAFIFVVNIQPFAPLCMAGFAMIAGGIVGLVRNSRTSREHEAMKGDYLSKRKGVLESIRLAVIVRRETP